MPVQTIAIVIGISHYRQEGIYPLPAAEIDAVNFARALKNWGIPEDNIFLFLNKEARKEIIDDFFMMLLARKENAKFIFYFCGHGHRTKDNIPKSYLMFYDSFLKSDDCLNSFSLDCLFERVAKMNILESYLFIDACHLRINHFINPKLEEEMKGKSSAHKSVFCLLSSGIEKSYESVHGRYGYFTRALLNSLCLIRKSEGSPTQLLRDIQDEMKAEKLPLPDMVNFGNQNISFIPNDDFFIDTHDKIYRAKFISEIQDTLIQSQHKVILLFGEEGCGKTTICQWLASEKVRVVYLEIPFKGDAYFDPENFLEEKIDEKFGCSFNAFDREYPSYLVIIDQLERLTIEQLSLLVKRLHQSINLRFLCASRQPLENPMSENDDHILLNLPIPVLSPGEGKSLIKRIQPDYSERETELSYLISRGSPLKIKKNAQIDMNFGVVEVEEMKKAIAAVYSCGAYYDKFLFMRVFDLQRGILDFFEQVGLILPFKDSFVPHPFLNEFAELEGLTTDSRAIFTYWYQQASSLPTHPQIAKSFILAIKCFGYKKRAEKILKKALHSLSVSKEDLRYFIDGAEVDLSLPYRTRVTVYLANALKKLGENELSNQLLRKKRNYKKLASLITLSLLVIISLSSRPIYVHMKHIYSDFVGRRNYLDQLEGRLIKHRKNEEARDKEAAETLSLRQAQALQKRTPFDQAKLYQKANNELMIVGISGLRMVDEGKDGGPNPIFDTLLSLLEKNVQVKLMIYAEKLVEKKENRTNLAISMVKTLEMQNKHPKHFECRILSIRPPFHGDLIDKKEAHIVPLTIKGMEKMPSDTFTIFIESYEKGETPENKFNLIRDDFQIIWERGEKITQKHVDVFEKKE